MNAPYLLAQIATSSCFPLDQYSLYKTGGVPDLRTLHSDQLNEKNKIKLI